MNIAERRKFLEAANQFVKTNDADEMAASLDQVMASLSALISEFVGGTVHVVAVPIKVPGEPKKGA